VSRVTPRAVAPEGASLRTAAVAFVASTLTGAALTPVVRHLARRWGLLDHALTSRKIHGKPIPRLGGIAIVLAFYAPLLALLFVNSGVGRQFWAHPARAFGLFGGGIGIALLGILDDLKGTNAKTKFFVQFLVAGSMYALGFRIDVISNPWGEAIQLGWLGLPFTMLWIAGVVNAMNLIDGLDGLAGGVALIAIATTFAVAALQGQPLMILFTAALAGAVLGFLFYNFNPASIFMGDTGSMFLGFVLATTAIQTNQKSSTAVAIVVPIIALAIPIGDTLLAMARRAARGVPLFSADRGHIHHRLQALGLSQRKAVLVLYGASLLLGGAALAVSHASSSQTTWFLIALSVVGYLALRKLGYFSLTKAQQVLAERKQNLEMRAAVRHIGSRLRIASGISDVWSALRATAEAVSASAIGFHLPDLEPLRTGFDALPPTAHRARFGLFPERPGNTHIELGWSDGRAHVNRDTEIAIELVCEHVSAALERLERFNESAAPLKVANLRR
jgi:UDP-GlcNAc:undecaprenyl-phosphate/decaprenyl-phosphate GlcNAc-1-phosphate transferase